MSGISLSTATATSPWLTLWHTTLKLPRDSSSRSWKPHSPFMNRGLRNPLLFLSLVTGFHNAASGRNHVTSASLTLSPCCTLSTNKCRSPRKTTLVSFLAKTLSFLTPNAWAFSLGVGSANTPNPKEKRQMSVGYLQTQCNTQPIHIRDSGSQTGLSHDVT
jgi:hypothetical protein